MQHFLSYKLRAVAHLRGRARNCCAVRASVAIAVFAARLHSKVPRAKLTVSGRRLLLWLPSPFFYFFFLLLFLLLLLPIHFLQHSGLILIRFKTRTRDTVLYIDIATQRETESEGARDGVRGVNEWRGRFARRTQRNINDSII